MHLNSAAQFLGISLLSNVASAAVLPERSTNSYLTNAHSAITEMQTFYNDVYNGDWSAGWWNSAQCMTLLADLRKSDSSSFLTSITDGANGVFLHSLNAQPKNAAGALTWDNYFDDELWWVLALIATYDATGNRAFLTAANESFALVAQSDTTSQPCGGLYNANAQQTNPPRVPSSTIATVLFVDAAAQLANRMPAMKAHYVALAKTQWTWIMNNLYIDGILQGDSLAGSTCTNNHAFLTYIEGVGISAGVAMYYATGTQSYLTVAETIATNTMSGAHGMVVNGIVTEFCDSNLSCNPDEAQFKGVLMRGLQKLYATAPGAVSGTIPAFIQKQATSIWANSRGTNNLLGMRWAGPWAAGSSQAVNLAQHSAATMALVYAYLV